MTLNEITVPFDRPVRMRLQSKDVIHSFFLPNFRVKQDAVPGMTPGGRVRADADRQLRDRLRGALRPRALPHAGIVQRRAAEEFDDGGCAGSRNSHDARPIEAPPVADRAEAAAEHAAARAR